ncbi:hypothetical protein [Microbacterium sp. gxy059]|uniref:hypothetical protein n=1 Tax=Microbacterium sp. gxy059 TaxID=2957199 RepID=UPI003D99C952
MTDQPRPERSRDLTWLQALLFCTMTHPFGPVGLLVDPGLGERALYVGALIVMPVSWVMLPAILISVAVPLADSARATGRYRPVTPAMAVIGWSVLAALDAAGAADAADALRLAVRDAAWTALAAFLSLGVHGLAATRQRS